MKNTQKKNRTKIEAVIFDLDGVIVDTVPYHFASWKKLFLEEGQEITWRMYEMLLNGLPRHTGIVNVLGRVSVKELARLANRKQELYREMILAKPPKVFPGVRTTLRWLRSRGKKIAVASSSKNVRFILGRVGLQKEVDVIVGGGEFKHPKPAPDIFLLAAKRLGCKPSVCIVVEDAATGIRAAKRAGAMALGAATSEDKEKLKIAGADKVIGEMRQSKQAIRVLSQD